MHSPDYEICRRRLLTESKCRVGPGFQLELRLWMLCAGEAARARWLEELVPQRQGRLQCTLGTTLHLEIVMLRGLLAVSIWRNYQRLLNGTVRRRRRSTCSL